MKRRRFVLLDRDGTMIEERHYLSDPAGVQLLPEAARGLRRMTELGLGLVAITNQSAIGRGYFDEARLNQIHDRLYELLREQQVSLDGLHYCPHLPEDHCECRKSEIALAMRAAQELDFDHRDSFVIGDKECDVEMGQRLGATTILVLTGYGHETDAKKRVRPDFVVADLSEAASAIERLLEERH